MMENYNDLQSRNITVQIIEDYSLIKSTIKGMLSKNSRILVTRIFSNTHDYLNQIPKAAPNILILDLDFEGSKGLNELTALKRFSPKTKIILFDRILNHSYEICCFK